MYSFRGWPGGARAAVSLTFDDAAPSQLEHALPVLDRWRLPGTFYVNPTEGGRFEADLARWQAAAARGHELGNHSLRHPCSGNFAFISPERALELWTPADVEADVLAAADRLRQLVPGVGAVSFAYPCGQTFVGSGAGRQSYVPVIARHFTVARGVGESANNPSICDLLCLSSWMVKGLTAAELVALLEPAVAAGHWAIFCFHGIGGDHIAIDTGAFVGLVEHLAAHTATLWTGTVQEVGSFLASARARR
jgi:peptidoglycan/xylan/chitin deacetylase (PgdA/CDA1 family)